MGTQLLFKLIISSFKKEHVCFIPNQTWFQKWELTRCAYLVTDFFSFPRLTRTDRARELPPTGSLPLVPVTPYIGPG